MLRYIHNLRFVNGKLQERVEGIYLNKEDGEESRPEMIWVDVPDTNEQDDGYRES